MQIPNKSECFYILEMLESDLIDYCYTHPWADKLISGSETPPAWLCNLAVKKYKGDQISAIREFIFAEPFEEEPVAMEKFHVACLWLRYQRRELSWATLLRESGEHLDAACGDWDCETPYHYLNQYEDAYFSPEAEEKTKSQYLVDHDLEPWIELAKSKFEPFFNLEWLKRANNGN